MNPVTPAGQAGLSALVRDPRHALLAFDFDGVLSPIVAEPDQAQPLPGIFRLLARVGRRAGSVAIITGRPVSFVTSRTGFAELAAVPGFAIYGHYGLERWRDGTTQRGEQGEGDIAAVRAELADLVRQSPVAADSWIEDKGSAVAVLGGAVAPALQAVVAVDSQARDGRELGEAGPGGHERHRAAGDDSHRAYSPAEAGQHAEDARQRLGLVRFGHDRRQDPVEVERQQGVPRIAYEGRQPGLARRRDGIHAANLPWPGGVIPVAARLRDTAAGRCC